MKNNIKRIILAVLLSLILIAGCTVIVGNKRSTIKTGTKLEEGSLEPQLNINRKDSIK